MSKDTLIVRNRDNTTLIPIKNNCTENMISTWNKLQSLLNHYQSYDKNPYHEERRINPICLLPDYDFKWHFLPNFFCETMIEPLICNRINDLNYLKALYNSTNGDDWQNNRYWMNDTIDYCQWHGVFCCNTSYPEYQTCLNMIRLPDNNMYGPLPSFKKYLKYSSVLTYIDLHHNYINGTIPDYYDMIPNLSFLKITHINLQTPSNTLSGVLPSKWPNANCTFWYDIHFNPYFSGTIPEWNSLKYMAAFQAASTNITGTIPNWDEWIWPLQIWISPGRGQGFLKGTIPKFSNTVCPLLEEFQLWNHEQLTGSVPTLPGQTPGASIRLRNNSLRGTFPWHSLNYVSKIELQDNDFHGEIVLSSKVKWILGINVTGNRFNGELPCFYDNKRMILIDARFNEFTSFDDNCKGWPSSMKIILVNGNTLNFNFDEFSNGLSNLSVIGFGDNQFKGTVPDHIIEGNADGIHISLYDNDFSCNFPDSNRTFNDSWIYIGNDMHGPFVSYTNKYEKGLGIIAIVPTYELYEYLIFPLSVGFITFIIYFILQKREEIKLRIDISRKPFIELNTKEKVLYIMQIATTFMMILFLISILMVIIYIKGANCIQCGYMSLHTTLTYLGTQTSKGYDKYSWISLVLFAAYSIVSTLLTTKLIHLSNHFATTESKQNSAFSLYDQSSNALSTTTHAVSEIANRSQILSNHFATTKPEQNSPLSLHTPSSNNHSPTTHAPIGQIQSNILSNHSDIERINLSLYVKILWFIKFLFVLMIFFLFLFVPIVIYNGYHAIPSSHTTIPSINNNYSLQFMIMYIVPIILATGKFFGVPWTINLLLEMLEQIGVNKKYRKNTYRNHLIQFIRFTNLVLIPMLILLTFDDKCFKIWKSWWEYCDEQSAACLQLDGSGVPHYNEGIPAWVCHDMCGNTQIVGYRCIRRLFEVLAPLYLYKMNIALWFPLLYYMKQREVFWKLKYYMKRLFCCGDDGSYYDYVARHRDKPESKEMDIEYMSLISSLEIIIVFGWAIPLLVPLYSVTIFGYWSVFSYGMHKYDGLLFKKLKETKSIKPVSNWLCLSLIIQHVLAFSFYYAAQSAIHGYLCLVIIVINVVVFALSMYKYQ